MTKQLSYLRDHLTRLNAQTEAWKVRHEEVMEHYEKVDDLAEAIAFGLFIYGRLKRSGAGRPEVPQRKVTLSNAHLICEFYGWWYQRATILLSAAEASEAAGFPVDGLDDFRAAHRDIGGLMHGVSKMLKSINAFQEGQGKDMKVVFDELQSDPGR
ncbi:MAG: hypothetical protein HQ581_24950 [Planctomycetes bacterium]|nr:hypothetical protein [Planctomycetota bacterium]